MKSLCILGAGILTMQDYSGVVNGVHLNSFETQVIHLDENVDEDDSHALEGTDVKVKNLYGIPDEDEKK